MRKMTQELVKTPTTKPKDFDQMSMIKCLEVLQVSFFHYKKLLFTQLKYLHDNSKWIFNNKCRFT